MTSAPQPGEASVMRRSTAALAIIRQAIIRQGGEEDPAEERWLARWNTKWRAFALVGGHKRPDESFRECLIREIDEELGLQFGAQYSLAGEPLRLPDFVQWSRGAARETLYTMELFEVQLSDPATRERVASDPQNCWLTRQEILAQRTRDGREVSPTVGDLLQKLELQKLELQKLARQKLERQKLELQELERQELERQELERQKLERQPFERRNTKAEVMDPNSYQPTPIDTAAVALPEAVLELTERLAENAHDIWARQRISDGWKFGAERNDARREHPCLIPYADLPESEKAYDRNAALETLKAIVALGYRVERCGDASRSAAPGGA